MSIPTETVDRSTQNAAEQLAHELADYRHAYETTAADRDRLKDQLRLMVIERDRYKHAFETTAADRDRLLLRAANAGRDCATNAVLPYSIVLSRPKTASMFVEAAILRANLPGDCTHIHALSPGGISRFHLEHPWSSSDRAMADALACVTLKRAYRKLGVEVGRAYVATVVRDPIERALSDYFFFVHHKNGVGDEQSLARVHAIKAADAVEHLARYDWSRDGSWFAEEIEGFLGIAVADFDIRRGWGVYESEICSVLVIKVARLQAVGDALQRLYGWPLTINDLSSTVNTSEDFGYQAHYRAVLSQLKLPREIIDAAHCTEWARRFFSEEELRQSRGKWSR